MTNLAIKILLSNVVLVNYGAIPIALLEQNFAY